MPLDIIKDIKPYTDTVERQETYWDSIGNYTVGTGQRIGNNEIPEDIAVDELENSNINTPFLQAAQNSATLSVNQSLSLSEVDLNDAVISEKSIDDPIKIRPGEIVSIGISSLLGFNQKIANNLTTISENVLGGSLEEERTATLATVQLITSLISSIFPGIISSVFNIGLDVFGDAILDNIDDALVDRAIRRDSNELLSTSEFGQNAFVRVAPEDDISYGLYSQKVLSQR
jgi:GH24 family phage-related lysozyme (muramidase)